MTCFIFFYRHIVADNYHSVTEKSFKPYRGADGTEQFPNTTKQVGSGFVRQKPLTVPTAEEVVNNVLSL